MEGLTNVIPLGWGFNNQTNHKVDTSGNNSDSDYFQQPLEPSNGDLVIEIPDGYGFDQTSNQYIDQTCKKENQRDYIASPNQNKNAQFDPNQHQIHPGSSRRPGVRGAGESKALLHDTKPDKNKVSQETFLGRHGGKVALAIGGLMAIGWFVEHLVHNSGTDKETQNGFNMYNECQKLLLDAVNQFGVNGLQPAINMCQNKLSTYINSTASDAIHEFAVNSTQALISFANSTLVNGTKG
ncbi:MAG: hypothetical protein ACK5WP_09705 [Neisseriaceae bacterium]